ncbi:MAG: hypothetical protein ACXVCS_15340 [Bdellovibrionota bacterium]
MKTLNLLTAAILVLTAGSAHAESEQVGSAVSNLTQRYESLIRVPDDDPSTGGDLQIDCLSLVFQNWSKSYLVILDSTAIDPQTVGAPLTSFGKEWFGADDDLKVAEYFRPGVTQVLGQVIEEVRAAQGGPAPLDPKKISLADIQDAQYFSNLKLCLSQDIIDKSLPRLKAGDITAPIPPGLRRSKLGSVSWVKTPNGGIRPVWSEPSSVFTLAIYTGDSDSVSYREYLRERQNR